MWDKFLFALILYHEPRLFRLFDYLGYAIQCPLFELNNLMPTIICREIFLVPVKKVSRKLKIEVPLLYYDNCATLYKQY